MIYADNASTSFPKAPGVGEAMAEFIAQGAYNINRGSYAGAFSLEEAVLETRLELCSFFGAENPRYAVFTAGVTMSLNLFLLGYLRRGDHVVATSMEHNAVLRPLALAKKRGIAVSLAQAGKDGIVPPEAIERLFRPNTRAVVMLYGSNVCGAIMPIGRIGRLCRERGIAFAVDTAQTAGSIPVQMEEDCIDFLAFSGHKGLLGPQGIGGFLVAPGVAEELEPVLAGGTGSFSHLTEQPEPYPDRMESGTLNLPGILGLRQSLQWLKGQDLADLGAHKALLAERFASQVRGYARIVGDVEDKRLGVVSLDFSPMDNAQVAYALEERFGIMIRTGLHCAPLAHQSLGSYPQGTVRFSFGAWNTLEEADVCAEAVREILRG